MEQAVAKTTPAPETPVNPPVQEENDRYHQLDGRFLVCKRFAGYLLERLHALNTFL